VSAGRTARDRERRRLAPELIGRGTDHALLERLVQGGAPLVTLTGPAGVGKTALARSLPPRWQRTPASDLDEALARYDRSCALSGAAGNSRGEAIDLAYGGLVLAEQGATVAARARIEDALPRLVRFGEVQHAQLFGAVLGAVLAELSELELAEESLSRAEAELEQAGDLLLFPARLCRGHLELAMARHLAALGNAVDAAAWRDRASRRLAEAIIRFSSSSTGRARGGMSRLADDATHMALTRRSRGPRPARRSARLQRPFMSAASRSSRG